MIQIVNKLSLLKEDIAISRSLTKDILKKKTE